MFWTQLVVSLSSESVWLALGVEGLVVRAVVSICWRFCTGNVRVDVCVSGSALCRVSICAAAVMYWLKRVCPAVIYDICCSVYCCCSGWLWIVNFTLVCELIKWRHICSAFPFLFYATNSHTPGVLRTHGASCSLRLGPLSVQETYL